jgi:putative tryptophan/tyrosine transport system substrate-binding protein
MAVADPVADGLAASLARPGGNFTGLSISADDFGPKHLELLKAATPKLSRVAVLVHPRNPSHPLQVKRIMSAAQKVGIQVVLAEAGTVAEVESEFAMITKERASAVMIRPDTFFDQESRLIAARRSSIGCRP